MPQRQQKKSAPLKQLPTNDHIDKLLWISFREDPAQSVYPVHGHDGVNLYMPLMV